MMKQPKRSQLISNKEHQRRNTRVRLYDDEIEAINNLRRLWNEAVDSGMNPTEVKHGWLKDKTKSLFVKNHLYQEPEERQIKDLFQELLSEFKEYKPKFPKIEYKKCKDPHLFVLDPADIHVGKLCSSFETAVKYDSQIAVQRVREGVEGLLNKIQGYDIEQIVFVAGNDVLHVDTPKRTTTSGTPQDTSGMWYDNVLMAKDLYVDIIERLRTVAPVHCMFNPSNHDYMSGFMLLQIIEAWFKDCEDVDFNASMAHRKYYSYGDNLIGTTHGDGAKLNDLPLLMASEAKEWSKCKKRYLYTHHIHHYKGKDYPGVTLESLRSPSEADSWHHRNGYEHSPVAIEGFLHHKKHGQVNKLTHHF